MAILTFPSNLIENQKMTFHPCKAPTPTQNLLDYEKFESSAPVVVGSTICLPLPANFEDALNHTWSINHGIGKGTAARFVGDATKAYLPSSLDSLLTTGQEATGAHVEPNYFYSYVETLPRGFSYSVNCIPRNKKEADTILSVINTFKKYSSPKKGNTLVENFVWKMKVANKVLSKSILLSKKIWALTSITTNYTGAGSALFFDDGNPKQINLSLTFQEITTMYSEDW